MAPMRGFPGGTGDDFVSHVAKSFSVYLARRKTVFLLAYVGYFSCYLVRNNVKVLGELLSQTHDWSPTQIGVVLTGFTLTYGFGKFIMGIVVDRTSLRTTFALALAVSAIACILMAFINSLPLLFVAMAVIGIAQGACAPAALSMIGGWYPNALRGSRVAIWNTSQNLGGATLPLLIGSLLAITGPDNVAIAFWLPGVIALMVSLWCWRSGGDRPWREGMPTLVTMFGARGVPQLGTERLESYWSVMRREVLTSRLLLVVATINTLLYFVRFGVINWIPIYLTRTKGFSFEQTSIVFGILEWAAIPGSLIFAVIARRWPNRMSAVGSLCIGGLVIALAGYALASSFTSVIFFAVILGAFIYGPQLIVNIMTLNFVSARAAGAAVGFVGLGGYTLGEIGANLIMPVVAQQLGWGASLLVLMVTCLVCAGLYASLRSAEKEIIRI